MKAAFDRPVVHLRRLLLLLAVISLPVGTLVTAHAGPPSGNGASGDRTAQDLPVYLYFGEPAGRFLTGEPIAIENPGDPLLHGRRIIEALIAGPRGALIPTLPEKTALRAVYIDGRTAYVDFSKEIVETHPGGVRSELLTVYSIVNTLVLNMEEIDRVKILVEGNEAETLVGHIAITYPLNAQMLLVR